MPTTGKPSELERCASPGPSPVALSRPAPSLRGGTVDVDVSLTPWASVDNASMVDRRRFPGSGRLAGRGFPFSDQSVILTLMRIETVLTARVARNASAIGRPRLPDAQRSD